MSFYEDLKRNINKLRADNSDLPFPALRREDIQDRMQFPIGRVAVDPSRVTMVNPEAIFNPLRMASSAEGTAVAGYNPFLDAVRVNPQAGADGYDPATLAHEFRHRAGRWSLPTDKNHERITVLDMLESTNSKELQQARTYNQSFHPEDPLLNGQGLLAYMQGQKGWIVKESLEAAKQQGLPPEDYAALVDRLTRRMLTDPQTQGNIKEVTDPDYRRYLQNKSNIQKRRQQLNIQYGSTFSDDMSRPGPTRAKAQWENAGMWTSSK